MSSKKSYNIWWSKSFFMLTSVHPEIVDFGFRQGPREFSTADIACYFEVENERERRRGPKDAVSG
jgi:hypothetical protein